MQNCLTLFKEWMKKNRNIEGTGLGLAITLQLVELMNGSVEVESEYGKGSTFRVEFPQDIVDASPIGKLSSKMDSVIKKQTQDKENLIAPEGKILVVDDVEMNLKVFCGLLKHTQLQIDTATSGRKALELAAYKKYHIIFLDHMMPEMDGIETFREFKQMDSTPNVDTPVIMLTANAIVGMRDEYLQDGFTDYLPKPVQGSQLQEMIRKYLPVTCIKASQNDEKEQKEKELSTVELLERLDFLDTKTGIMYCANSEELYIEILKTYIENDKTEILKQCYIEQDWKQYCINIHALKSTSLSIGACELSENAKEMESKIKEGNLEFVYQEHEALLNGYKEILKKIKVVLIPSVMAR